VTGTTTVGSGTTLQFAGGTLTQSGALTNGGEVTGYGIITGAGSVTNNGSIDATGGTLDLSGINLTNLSAGTLTGAGDTFAAGFFSTAGTLKLPGDIATNDGATILLGGAGSEITDVSNGNALAGLTTNEGAGTLELSTGATLTTTGALTNTGGSLIEADDFEDPGVLTIGGNLTNKLGSFVLDEGGTINVNGTLSNDATSVVEVQSYGSMMVASSVMNAGTVDVGFGNNGTLTVTGNYTNSGTTGVGDFGTLTINGNYTTSGTTQVGQFGIGGTITVEGAGGYDNTGGTTTVDVNGAINVTNGYTNGVAVTVVNGTLDSGSFSTTGGGTTTVGNGGTLSVTNTFTNAGSTSVSGALSAGAFSNSSSLTVQGGTLTATSGGFTNNGTGTLTMNGTDGTVNVTGGFTNNGTVSLTGTGDNLNTDTFANTSSVSVGAGETLMASGSYTQTAGGSTTIQASGVLNSPDVTASGGTLTVLNGIIDPTTVSISGTATLQGTGTVVGNVTMTGGTIQPGVPATPGTLTITGSYSQTGGTFLEQISSTASGLLNVSGNVSLTSGSALTINLLGGFNPMAGTTYTILDYGSLTGGSTFSITDPTFNSGSEQWVIASYDYLGDNEIGLEAESVGGLVTATWGPPSPSANTTGNWTEDSGSEWSCTSGAGPATNCVPNNAHPPARITTPCSTPLATR